MGILVGQWFVEVDVSLVEDTDIFHPIPAPDLFGGFLSPFGGGAESRGWISYDWKATLIYVL